MLRKLLCCAPKASLSLGPSASVSTSTCCHLLFYTYTARSLGQGQPLCLYSATQSKAHFTTRTRGERRAVLQTTAKHHCGKNSCVCQRSLLQKAEKPRQTFLPTLVCLQLLLTNQRRLDLEAVSPRDTPVPHTLKPLSLIRERIR